MLYDDRSLRDSLCWQTMTWLCYVLGLCIMVRTVSVSSYPRSGTCSHLISRTLMSVVNSSSRVLGLGCWRKPHRRRHGELLFKWHFTNARFSWLIHDCVTLCSTWPTLKNISGWRSTRSTPVWKLPRVSSTAKWRTARNALISVRYPELLSLIDKTAVFTTGNCHLVGLLWSLATDSMYVTYVACPITGIAEWLASRTSKQEGPGSIPGGGNKFSDGTCKYLPFVELLLCWN